MADLKESIALLDEFTHAFQSEDDVARVRAIRSIQSQVRAHCEEQQLRLKGLIEDLTGRVQRVEKAALEPEDRNTLAQKVKDMRSEQDTLRTQIEEVQKENSERQRRVENLRSEYEQLREHHGKIMETRTVNIPQLSQILSLYATVTNIKWVDNGVSGFVLNKTHKDIHPFRFEGTEDPVLLADALWDAIAEGL